MPPKRKAAAKKSAALSKKVKTEPDVVDAKTAAQKLRQADEEKVKSLGAKKTIKTDSIFNHLGPYVRVYSCIKHFLLFLRYLRLNMEHYKRVSINTPLHST